jgi:hypothetical protein
MNTDLGPFAPLVGLVGSIAAMGLAVGVAFRGRSRWEPSEEDIASGPQRVAGLGTAVLVAIMFALTRQMTATGPLPELAIGAFVLSLVSLLLYGIVTSTQTYRDGKGRRLIGGFTLTRAARRTMSQKKIRTVQQLFAGAAYDPDEIWPRSSRAIAKAVFVLLYIVLTVSGSVAIAGAAIAVEKATAPRPPTIDQRSLRWISARDAVDVLDGAMLVAGKRVWLRELFPSTPPTSFRVVEVAHEWLPQGIRDAIAATRLPTFAPIVEGYFATSDAAWILPAATPGVGSRTFYFVDVNPEGTEEASGTITAGDILVREAPSTSCAAAGEDGAYITNVGEPGCVTLAVSASVDPIFDVEVLLPWGAAETNLVAALDEAFTALDQQTRTDGGSGFDAAAAVDAFVQEHAAELPAAAPAGWQISGPGQIEVAAGQILELRLDVATGAPGVALFAVRFRDQANGATVLSPLLRLEAVGEPVNEPPRVEIVLPKADVVGDDRLAYSGFESDMWYVDMELSARATDPEDGDLLGDFLIWTTDQTDIQAPELGRGETIRARLYSPDCEGGRIHTITVTGQDSQGLTASATRVVAIGQVC